MQEYSKCVRDTGFYFNSDTNMNHYFRICKYHETLMKDKNNTLKYTNEVTSFFEFYDLALKKKDKV